MTEQERLNELRGYGVLDTPSEPAFDAIAREASLLCRTPIALVSFVDEHRQWFKAKVGLSASETPRSISFCTHAIHGNEPMVVSDATSDPRVATSPLVTNDPNIRYYAGVPLRTESGARLGTLCVIDSKPRQPRASEIVALERLAAEVVKLLKQRKSRQGGASARSLHPGQEGGQATF